MSFQFQQFAVADDRCAMKIGTDGVLLGAWTDLSQAAKVVDLGAGSGLLSLMVAQRNPASNITAVEIDADAAADCAENFRRSTWAQRLNVHCADATIFRPTYAPDLVISNPPFFDQDLVSPQATRALARHDGRLCPDTVVRWAAAHLSPIGSVALIMPTHRTDDIIYIGEVLHLKEWRRLDVSTKTGQPPSRTLLQLSRACRRPQRATLDIRDAGGKYTAAYKQLTHDFYLYLKK